MWSTIPTASALRPPPIIPPAQRHFLAGERQPQPAPNDPLGRETGCGHILQIDWAVVQ
jgi:hypothetical protein